MRRSTLSALILATFALSATAASAAWEDHAAKADVWRLSQLQTARERGMEAALRGAPRDAALIRGVLGPRGHGAAFREIAGSWRCRTIKLGGMTPDVVYGWFNCRIGMHDGHPFFEKVSGTQRFQGYLDRHEGGAWVFMGGMNVSGTPMAVYSGGGQSAGAESTPSDVVGLLTVTGPGSARLEMPYPAQESIFDVIEMRR